MQKRIFDTDEVKQEKIQDPIISLDGQQYGLNIKKPCTDAVKSKLDKPILGILNSRNEKEKYDHDIKNRSDDVQYSKIAVEDFGVALLRGMGWEKGKPVGKNPKGLVEPISLKSRPHLLGLGAKLLDEPIPSKEEDKPKRNENTIKETKYQRRNRFVKSDFVKIIAGRHSGKKGTVASIDKKSSGIVIKVDVKEKELARVWEDDLESLWLRPHLKVRIVSESRNNGKFYGRLAIIQDVSKKGKAVLRMLEGNGVLLDVTEQEVETLIPPLNSIVMVVMHNRSSLVGQLAKVIECENQQQKALIRMEQSFEILTVNFNQISEFVDDI